MTKAQPNRRHLLKRAGALGALAALLNPTEALAKPTTDPVGPEGSWLVTVTVVSPGGIPSPFLALETYAAGGGYTETDQLSFMPSFLASPGHGAWVRRGERQFALTYLSVNFNTKGTPQGTTKVSQVSTLNQKGDAYSGSGKFDVFDLHGKRVLSGSFRVQARRINVEAL